MKRSLVVQAKRFQALGEEFEDKVEKAFDFSRDGDPSVANGVWDEEIKAFADPQTLKSLFFSEDWVFISVDLCAQKLSSVPLRIARQKVVNNAIVTEALPNHPLNKLIARPNQWEDYHSWMYRFICEDVLMGNGVNWFAPQKFEMYVLPADRVNLSFKSGGLKSYHLSIGNTDDGSSTQLIANADRNNIITFPVNEIIHTRRPNPSSLVWGLSPFVPGRKVILFNRYSADYLNSFYLKQATPAMAITMDRTVNEDLALRQLASFEMAYTGRRNQRRTLLLPKGTDAKPLTHTIADQKLVDMIGTNRETIINLLKIPKHELALTSAGSLGSEEFKIALRNFWEATLIPTGNRVEGGLTMFFRDRKLLKDNEVFKFDYSGVKVLQEDLMQKSLIAHKMAETLPLNTVISELWEHEKIDDPKADLPLSIQPKVSVSRGGENDAAGGSDEATDSSGDNDGEKPGSEETEGGDEKRAFVSGFMHDNKSTISGIIKQFDSEVADKEEQLIEIAFDLFVEFADKAIELVPENLVDEKYWSQESWDLKGYQTKASIKDKRKLRKELIKALSKFEAEFVEKLIRTLENTVEIGFDTQIQFIFNEDAKTEIEILRARDENKRRATLTSRGLDTFANISKTKTEEIMREIVNGVKANENTTQITSRIAGLFKNREKMLARAERIARTETLTAASIGQHAAFLNADEALGGKVEKIWINAGDERVRGNPAGVDPKAKFDHWVITLNGERLKAGERFSNGLLFPRDPSSADPANVINCRCTLALVLPGTSN